MVIQSDGPLDPMTGRRLRPAVVRPERGAQRVAAFNACVVILERLPLQDRDFVARRLIAYFATPKDGPDGADD